MTKNGTHWEAPVPAVVEPVLRRYIELARPWLLERGGQSHDQLWVDNTGRPFQGDYFGVRIARITAKSIGARVPPHFFRDAAATTLARLSPENAQLIRPLLGHSSNAIAEKHYIQATIIEAGRSYAELIARLREEEI